MMKKVLFGLVLVAFLMPMAVKAQTKATNHEVMPVTVCDSYEWINGETYTRDTAVVYLSGDTLYVLDLKVNHSSTITVSEPVEAGCSYAWGDSVYATNGTYTHTFTDGNGCDSTVTITLSIMDTAKIVIDTTVCKQFRWRGTLYTENGTFYDTVSASSATACDSTFKLTLTINTPDVSSIDTTVEGCNYAAFGATGNRILSEETIDTNRHILITANGACRDSVINIHLVVHKTQYVPRDTVSCGTFVWGNYSSEESSVDTLRAGKDIYGCDSLIVLNLTVKNDISVAIVGELDILTGASTTLKAECDQPATLTWNYNGQTSHDSTITLTNVQQNTDVSLTAATNEGCSRTTSVTVMASPYVGIDEIEQLGVVIYPNPTAARLMIESASAVEEIAIYNMAGQRVETLRNLGVRSTIDFANYNNGVYMLNFRMADGTATSKKVIVKK
ncbi:MAG: T9SS type A sorting domain-containing protein [Bacteroidales bacterium]|nr:T9SS type A sorting domain-containing protein [Bacteroidales bacterium]